MSLLHSSTRRPSPLKDTDYDHEINLIDHTRPESPEVARSRSVGDRPLSPGVASDSSSRRHSDVPLRKHTTPLRLREELTKRKYSKYQDRRLGQAEVSDDGEADDDTNGEIDNVQVDGEEPMERGRTRDNGAAKKSKQSPESAIDILYENQRGGFLCGMPLFSSSALGNLDPSPWTNSAQKTSATNITNAQVPDPSWEWAWPEWRINHTDEVDEDGWEYSFMFSKKFSWHGKSWYKSFVRRRAWIRKRVKKTTGYRVNEGHMLNSDYFTIHPAELRGSSRGSTTDSQAKRYSTLSISKREMEEGVAVEEIQDIGTLLKALRLARIDREKTEAVESFIEHGGDDLYYLRDHMHEIMGMFIFQASRRLLLSHLLQIFNKASEESEGLKKDEADPVKRRRLENLEAAVKHADEEVRKLEFWSDVKDMAEKGQTKGAVDESQGWDQGWSGLDNSAPKDVISDQKLPGGDSCQEGEGNGTAILNKKVNGKGKGKAKE